MKIQINHLYRLFGKKTAVNDISFEFESGNVFGFIGPNGAGKTTTIKIMATLDQPTSGDVLFDGISTVAYPEKVRRIVGFMPDSLPAFTDIKVWEYLDFYARAFGLKGEMRRKTLADVEAFTNLTGIREKYLNALSKGMKQRVSLARALVHNPQVLIMDEPAAGLDPRARIELLSLLKILAEQGKAILLSSHILAELQDICDGAVIIEQGKLLASGPLDHLMESAIQNRMGADAVPTAIPVTDEQPDGTPAPPPPIVMATPLIAITIRVLRDAEQVRLKLMEHPAVKQIDINSPLELAIQFDGTDEDIPPLMASLFAAGCPIIGFSKQSLGLEDVFMRITTGEVQ
ncbi:MAG: ABC transporter ATP-binding protein [Victivallales bacterium]|nr:ABC transporter ATP-binding protein [Victivallales bacterium]